MCHAQFSLNMVVNLYLFDEASDRNLDELSTRPSHSAKKIMSPANKYRSMLVNSSDDRSGHPVRLRRGAASQELYSFRSSGRSNQNIVPSCCRDTALVESG